MYEIFTRLLNLSFTASVLALVVLAIRICFRKIPKKYMCILWALVALRLICPINISSSWSALNLLPETTHASGQVEYFRYVGENVKPMLVVEFPMMENADKATDGRVFCQKHNELYMPGVALIWILGVTIMGVYALVGYFMLKQEVKASIKKIDNVYVCDEITAPFILGIIYPRVYLPSGLDETVSDKVIAHELAHIKRLDHIWKPLGFILLSLHWFNPIMWAAYIYLSKDIEGACDEKVIATMDKENVVGYSEALLICASKRRMITACPVAFGETDVKGRVRNVLNYKKPAFWIICVATLLCITVATVFLTDPKEINNDTEGLSESSETQMTEQMVDQTEGKPTNQTDIMKEQEAEQPTGQTEEVAEEKVYASVLPISEPLSTEISLFKEMEGEYWFLSGAGAWTTRMYLYSDGYFVGIFEDHDMMEVSRCEFAGRLQAPSEVNEDTYLCQIEELVYAEPGQVFHEGDYTITTAKPYGLGNTPSLYIYVPGMEVSSLSELEYSWLSAEREEFWDRGFASASNDVLPCYAIRNVMDKNSCLFSKVPDEYVSDIGDRRSFQETIEDKNGVD